MKQRGNPSTLLYIITCSNAKLGGGVATYNKASGLSSMLSPDLGNHLMECRRAIYKHIRDGGGTRQGKDLCALPYNKGLRNARDFSGSEEASFLPAHSRYIGRLYNEVPASAWENRKHHVIIISGLYGLLLPDEPIQRYSLDLKDSAITYNLWRDTLTLILQEFIERKGIERVIDGIGDGEYRSVIDWEYLRSLADVIHVFGDQNAGPGVLRAIGEFLGKTGFTADQEDLNKFIEAGGRYSTRYENLYFLESSAAAGDHGLPIEETRSEYSRTESLRLSAESVPELADLSKERARRIEISSEALDQWKELPAEIRGKVPATLDKFIANPRSAGLGAEKVKTSSGFLTRIRINDCYRIHLKSEKGALIVVAIGPHKLKGIG